jgi:hypothetical protein
LTAAAPDGVLDAEVLDAERMVTESLARALVDPEPRHQWGRAIGT